MGNHKFVNIAVFVLFFGLSLIEALQKHHWLLAILFGAVGALSLWADFQERETSMRRNLLIAIIALVIASGVVWYKEALVVPTVQAPVPESPAPETSIAYRNTDYGFSIALPTTWEGYSVDIGEWEGNATGQEIGNTPYAHGPLISIHNPQWTAAKPYQDIPIMVFTLDQWNELQQDKFHIGAAPINPSELARNAAYVFALPARYNYAFPPGYEEVDQILQSQPLTAF